jgi:hypothetical protein
VGRNASTLGSNRFSKFVQNRWFIGSSRVYFTAAFNRNLSSRDAVSGAQKRVDFFSRRFDIACGNIVGKGLALAAKRGGS